MNAAGNGTALTVVTGGYGVTTLDTRFDPATAISGNTINLGYDHGLETGDEIVYDDGDSTGGNEISGLTDGGVYYVIKTGPQSVQLASTICNAKGIALGPNGVCNGGNGDDGAPGSVAATPIGISGGSGSAHRLVPTDRGGRREGRSAALRPDRTQAPSTSPATGSSSRTASAPRTTTRSSTAPAAARPIGGLVDGGTYYYKDAGGGYFQLADEGVGRPEQRCRRPDLLAR